MMTAQLRNLVFIAIILFCTVFDIRYRKIPNILVAALMLLAICSGISFYGIICGVLLSIPMAKNKSYGDIKLIIAMGMYMGGIRLIITVCIALLICIIFMLISRKRSTPLAPFLYLGAILTLIGGFYFEL